MLPEPKPLIRALSFDDVIVMPGGPLVAPDKVSLETVFNKDHILKRPLVGLVDNAKDAIALAQQGLIGILSGDMPFGAQIEAARQVKRHQASLLPQPHTVTPDTIVAEAQDMQLRHQFSALPVVDPATHQVVGIVTRADIARAADPSDAVSTVMSTDLLSVDENATDAEVQRLLQEQMVGQILVIHQDGHLIGLRTASDFAKRAANPYATLDAHGRLLIGIAVGVDAEAHERVSAMLDIGADIILIDQPYAHNQTVQDMVTFIRRQRCEQAMTVIVGNVQTADGARALIDSGADMLWVKAENMATAETAVGVPGFTALQAVVDAASLLNVPVWVQCGFDSLIAIKALAAGASGILSLYTEPDSLSRWSKTLLSAIGQAGAIDIKTLTSHTQIATLK